MLHNGQVLDNKYEVVELLGEGGMSKVYLVKNKRLDCLCAIKEIRKESIEGYEFKCEVDILKRLNHIGIPRITDFFEEDGNAYIVEDYVEGKTLKDLIENNRNIPVQRIYTIIDKLCNILIYLHSYNPPVIYRDLKPSNIMITPGCDVKLIDFGIARLYKNDKTHDTVFMGSAGYMAPEQFNKSQSNVLTDIYSLGATINYIVTQTGLQDDKLQSIIKRAMEVDISKRYQSVNAVLTDVREMKNNIVVEKQQNNYDKTKVLEHQPAKRRRSLNKTAVVCILMLLVVCGIAAALKLLWKDNKPAEVAKTQVSQSKGESTDNNQASNDSSEIQNDKPVEKTVVKDYAVEGTVNTALPEVQSNPDSKNKGKNKKIHFFDKFYDLNPKAQAFMYDNSLSISVNSMEFYLGQITIYCKVSNSGSNSVTLGNADPFALYDDNNHFVKGTIADISGNYSIEAGQSDMDLIITFKNINTFSKYYNLRASAESDEDSAVRNVNLKVNVINSKKDN